MRMVIAQLFDMDSNLEQCPSASRPQVRRRSFQATFCCFSLCGLPQPITAFRTWSMVMRMSRERRPSQDTHRGGARRTAILQSLIEAVCDVRAPRPATSQHVTSTDVIIDRGRIGLIINRAGSILYILLMNKKPSAEYLCSLV